VQMKLELVILPVSDVDRSRDFYRDVLGFTVDVDQEVAPGVRIVQLTPPGSGCSVMVGTGLPVFTEMAPGSVRGLHLVVDGIEAARAELAGRGLDIGELQDVGGGVRYAGFADPDGNTLTLQEMAWRTGDAF
jgi:catechol 2,3-dioxygenase-like lactoylglutathione lyase family enzyme